VWKVRESLSAANILIAVYTVHVHIASAVVDRIIHAVRILEVSQVQTHLANLRLDKDFPSREFPRESLVLFRLLYVPKEHNRVDLLRAMCPDFEEDLILRAGSW